MDIEGSEFSVLNSIDFNKIKIGQLLIEFHERFIDGGRETLSKTINHLKENGFQCIAISDGHEYSFVNTNETP
jgi:hypothetical protein